MSNFAKILVTNIFAEKLTCQFCVENKYTVVRYIFVHDSVHYPCDPVKLLKFLKVRRYHSLLSSPLRCNFDLICITKKLAASFI